MAQKSLDSFGTAATLKVGKQGKIDARERGSCSISGLAAAATSIPLQPFVAQPPRQLCRCLHYSTKRLIDGSVVRKNTCYIAFQQNKVGALLVSLDVFSSDTTRHF